MAIVSKKSSRWGSKAASAILGGALLLSGSVVPAKAVVVTGSAGTVTPTKTTGNWSTGDLATTGLGTDLVCPSTDSMSGALVFISNQGEELPTVADAGVPVQNLYPFTQDALFQMSLDANRNIAAPNTLENGFRTSNNALVDNMAAAVAPNHTYSIGYVCTQMSPDFTSATVNAVDGKPVAAWAKLTTDAAGNWTISAADGTFSAVTNPTLTGTAAVGYVLTANFTAPQPAPDTTTIQWLRNGTPIAGGTGMSYRQVAEDRGQQMSVRVTHSKAGYVDSVRTSSAVTVKGVFSKLTAPKISGTAAVGYTVKASVVVPSPTPSTVTYRWLRNGAVISGATSTSYKLTALDRGKKISARAYFSRSGYLTASTTSSAIVPLAVFSNVVAPKVYGTAAVGYTLKSSVTKPSPLPSAVSYRWLRNGAVISGATSSSYKLTALDRGKQIRSRVYFIRSGYLTASATSAYKLVR